MKRRFIVITIFVILVSGCNLPAGTTTPETADEPMVPAAPPVEASTETAAPVLETVVPVTEASIVHLVQPGELPSSQAGHAGDQDSSITAGQKQAAGGDRHTFGRYERPFNADTMDVYFPYLDIVDTFVYQDNTWIYGVITMRSADDNGNLAGTYGVEFDMTLDGMGDLLVLASQPSSTEWTTDGVRVYVDSNSDVGGLMPTLTDDPPVFSDGFETKLFDSGMGDDPDLAWVRISPTDPLTVHIAIKVAAFGNSGGAYLVNMWAGNEDLDPALFDHNDHFTHEQSGAADKGLEFFYPIKEVSEIDNTCRMAVGFQPTGKEPGLCPLPVPDEPGGCNIPPPVNGCGSVAYLVWNPATCRCEAPTPQP